MNDWFTEAFATKPLMAILRGFGRERAVELARVAWDAGIGCVEVPIQSAAAVETLEAVAAAGRERGLAVGAGTVTSIQRVRQAVEMGAAFTVAPGVDEQVVRASSDAGIPHLPGVATASDIQRAHRLGATWVKAFPASVLGVEWFKAMKAPFPDTRFVATGGMNADNAPEYVAAGAHVIAVGSALEHDAQLESLATL